MAKKNVPSNSTEKLSSTEKNDHGKEDKGVTKKSVGSNFLASLLKREKRMGEKEGVREEEVSN